MRNFIIVILIGLFPLISYAQNGNLKATQQKGPGVSGGGNFVELEAYGFAQTFAQQLIDAEDVIESQDELKIETKILVEKLKAFKFSAVEGMRSDERVKPYNILPSGVVQINAAAWSDSLLFSKSRYVLQMALEAAQIPINYQRLIALKSVTLPNVVLIESGSLQSLSLQAWVQKQGPREYALRVELQNVPFAVEYMAAYFPVVRYECVKGEWGNAFDLNLEMKMPKPRLFLRYRCDFQNVDAKSKGKQLRLDESIDARDMIENTNLNVISINKFDVQTIDRRYQILRENNGVEFISEQEMGYGLRRIKIKLE